MARPTVIKNPEDPLTSLEADGTLAFDRFVTFKVNQLSMAFERQWTRYMRDRAGMSLAQWRIVATLAGAGPCTFTQVVQRTGMNKSLCSRCVASLEAEGFLESHPTPGDSRSLTLSLRRKATKLIDQLRPVVLERQRMLLESLTASERIALYSAVDKLHAAAARWEQRDDKDGGESSAA